MFSEADFVVRYGRIAHAHTFFSGTFTWAALQIEYSTRCTLPRPRHLTKKHCKPEVVFQRYWALPRLRISVSQHTFSRYVSPLSQHTSFVHTWYQVTLICPIQMCRNVMRRETYRPVEAKTPPTIKFYIFVENGSSSALLL